MLEMLRKKNEMLLEKYKDNDKLHIRLEIIKRLLSDDFCFFKISFKDAMNILNDLGYFDKEAMDIYMELISPNEYLKSINE